MTPGGGMGFLTIAVAAFRKSNIPGYIYLDSFFFASRAHVLQSPLVYRKSVVVKILIVPEDLSFKLTILILFSNPRPQRYR